MQVSLRKKFLKWKEIILKSGLKNFRDTISAFPLDCIGKLGLFTILFPGHSPLPRSCGAIPNGISALHSQRHKQGNLKSNLLKHVRKKLKALAMAV